MHDRSTSLRSWSWQAWDRDHAARALRQARDYMHEHAIVNHEHAFAGILDVGCEDCPVAHAVLVFVGAAQDLPPVEEVPSLSQFLEKDCGVAPVHDVPTDVVERLWAARKHPDGEPCHCYSVDDV